MEPITIIKVRVLEELLGLLPLEGDTIILDGVFYTIEDYYGDDVYLSV